LKPDAPAYPHRTSTGDSDKLRRAVQDALTGVVYLDDKLVVDGADRKDYHSRACCIIHVGLMEAQTAVEAGLAEPLDPVGQETLLAA
jgi:Holliday junction resolvase RusA-like endonuclease